MSDSIPDRTPAANEPAAIHPPAPGAASARWWLTSAVFHGLLLTWLFCFSRVRLFNPAEKPKVNASAVDVKKVIHEIQARQLPSLEQNLAKLESIREKMAGLEIHKLTEFTNYAEEMGKGAPAKAAQLQQAIAQLQGEALAWLDQAGANCRLAVDSRANAYYDEFEDDQKQVAERQARIAQLQDKAEALLSFGDDRYALAREAQSAAGAAQDRAAQARLDAEKARSPSRNTTHRTAREGQIEHFTYWLRRNLDTVNNATTNLLKAKKDIATSEAVLAWAQTNAAKAATNASALNTDEATMAAKQANTMLERAGRDLASAQRRLLEMPKAIETAKRDIPDDEANVKKWLDTPEPIPVTLSAEDKRLVELQAGAREAQLEARRAQEEAAKVMASIPSTGGRAIDSMASALSILDKMAPNERTPSATGVKGMDVSEIYDSAVKTESSLAVSYRRLRAAHLAKTQGLALSKAVSLTEVARPERPKLAAALHSPVDSGEEAVAARVAVQMAKLQLDSMVQLASSMLAEAQGLDNSAGVPVTFQEYEQNSELADAIEKLASADSGWAMDETSMMKNGKKGQAGRAGKPGRSGGNGQSGDGGDIGDASGGGDVGSAGQPGGQNKPGGQNGENGNGQELGESGVNGPFGPGGFGHGGVPGAGGAAGQPEDIADRVHPFPGRRVAAHGTSPRWLNVDSWYVIGPFDNSDRQNIDRKFPPETIIDLNAAYIGNNGTRVRWEFQQSGTPNVRPLFKGYNALRRDPLLTAGQNAERNLQYVIYYAYTELWFEKECDLWVAFGSDDFGKVWVENTLVWMSGKDLKGWQINESVRKVHFKEGINRVLYRIENGNGPTEYSMVLSLEP